MSRIEISRVFLCAEVLLLSKLIIESLERITSTLFKSRLFFSIIFTILLPYSVLAGPFLVNVYSSNSAKLHQAFYFKTSKAYSFALSNKIDKDGNPFGKFDLRYRDKKRRGGIKTETSNILPVAKLCSWGLTLPADKSSVMADGSCSYDPDGHIVFYHWILSGTTPGGGKVRIESPDSAKTELVGLENGYKYVIKLEVTDNNGAKDSTYYTIYVEGAVSKDPLKSSVDFSDSAYQLSNYFLETGEPWSLNISDSLNNNPSGRFELRYGDKIMGKSSRSQILFNSLTGEEVWTGFNIYFPESWKPDPIAPEIFFAYHTWSNNGGSRNLNPPVDLIIRDGKLISEIRYSHVENPTNLNDIEIRDTIGAPIIGKWVSYVIHAKFDQTNGFVEIWQNGSKVINYSGQVSYKHTRPPVPSYGIYKWYWHETGPSDVSKRVLYLDDIKIADGGGSYGLVAPPQKKNNIPIASVKKKDIEITLPKTFTVLDGSSSKDSDGKIISWKWKQLSGPATAVIVNPNAVRTEVSGLKEGTYSFQLTVTDDDNESSTAKVTVKVDPAPNKAPVAAIKKKDIEITLPEDSTILDGGPSKDSDGNIVSYQWEQKSDPSTATIADQSSAKTEVTGLQKGIYVFNLIIKDNDGATDTAEAKVTVQAEVNKPPIADAGNNLSITLPENSITLNGSASTDGDGNIVSYKWEQKSGPSTAVITDQNSAETKVTGLQAEEYIFQLTVKDNNGTTSTSQVMVTVDPASDKLPVAKVKSDEITITLPKDSVTLDGSLSKDSDGRIVSYQWEQESGPSASIIIDANAEKTSVTGFEAGIYVFQLTVKDDNGATSTSKMTITVRPPPNKPPVAKVKNSELTITLPKDSVTLDGSGSTDSDGKITSYKWKQQLGPSSATITDPNAAQTKVTGLKEGIYVFNLIVKDDDDATSTAEVKVTVLPVPNKPPVAKIDNNEQTITLPKDSISLDGSPSSDSDGKIVSWQWQQKSGPSASEIADPKATQTKVTGLKEGIYIFNLTVKDNKGTTSTSKITITVNPATNKPPVAKVKNNELTITLPKDSAILDGSESTDRDGKITSYQWKQKSGPSASVIADPNAVQTKVTGLKEGIYVFNLIIKDNDGETDAAKVTVTVNPKPNQPLAIGPENSNVAATSPNKPPVAKVKDEKITITLPEDSVTLDGSGSTDSDGKIVSYKWKQQSGPSASAVADLNAAKTKVTGLKEGKYIFSLIIKDDKGANSTSKVTITVHPSPNKPPLAKVENDQLTITLPKDSVMLDGGPSADNDGEIISYQWKQKSGPSAITIIDPKATKTKVKGLKKGKYVFHLIVKDNDGAKDTAEIRVTAKPAQSELPAIKGIWSGADTTLPVLGETQDSTANFIMGNTGQTSSSQSLIIYPNPASNIIYMQFHNHNIGKIWVMIYDENGRTSQKQSFYKDLEYFNRKLDISRLANGIHFIQVQIGNHISTCRLVKVQ